MVKALLDSGATACIVDESIARKMNGKRKTIETTSLRWGNINLVTNTMIETTINIGRASLSAELIIIKKFPHDLFLGTSFLKHCVLDLPNRLIRYGSSNAEELEIWDTKVRTINAVTIHARSRQIVECRTKQSGLISNDVGNKKLRVIDMIAKPRSTDSINVVLINNTLDDVQIPAGEVIASIEPVISVNKLSEVPSIVNQAHSHGEPKAAEPVSFHYGDDIPPQIKEKLAALTHKFRGVFAEKLSVAGAAKLPPVKIPMVPGAKPKYRRTRRYSPKEKEIIDAASDKMLQQQAIEDAPVALDEEIYNSDVILVGKKDGDTRFCVDFRDVNRDTLKDKLPLPRIEDIIDALAEAKIFSKFDLTSGYWQLLVDEKDRNKLAFTTDKGKYRFRCMAFGLTNAPSHFQRMITFVLNGIRCVIVFIDDIIVFSRCWEEHLVTLEQVLERFVKYNLIAKPSKCLFGTFRIEAFGYAIGPAGVSPDPRHVEAISKMPQPRDAKEVGTFLGMIGYFHRFIKHCSVVERPLRLLTTKGFKWEEEHSKVFEFMKGQLAAVPTLRIFNPKLPTHVHTDASNVGIGATLVQVYDKVVECPVQYFSRTLRESEKNYATIKKELIAVFYAVKKFRPYLHGRSFTVYTDHKPLVGLVTKRIDSDDAVTIRSITYLSGFDMTLVYKKGKDNVDADCLSRLPADLPALEPFLSSDVIRVNSIVEGVEDTGRRMTLVKMAHDGPMGVGHLGIEKTYEVLKRDYYWKNMTQDIKRFVESCQLCIQKMKRKVKHGIPVSLPFGGPWEILCMDMMGPLPDNGNGKTVILVVVDSFTKDLEVKAVKDQTAATVTKFVLSWVVSRHGVPREVLTDNGKNFIAKGVELMYEILGIKGKKTTPYNPEGNGLVERVNRTIGTMLRTAEGEVKLNWSDYLPAVAMAYRSSKHKSTGRSPFELNNGRQMMLPMNLTKDSVRYSMDKEYFLELERYLNEIQGVAIETLKKDRQQRNDKLSRFRSPLVLEMGDLVWYHYEEKSGARKFHWNWKGPARIIKKINNQAYVIQNMKNKTVHRINIRRLRRYSSLEEEVEADYKYIPNVKFGGDDRNGMVEEPGNVAEENGNDTLDETNETEEYGRSDPQNGDVVRTQVRDERSERARKEREERNLVELRKERLWTSLKEVKGRKFTSEVEDIMGTFLKSWNSWYTVKAEMVNKDNKTRRRLLRGWFESLKAEDMKNI